MTDDPARIVDALTDAGWETPKSSRDTCVRFFWPAAFRRSLVVPLDQAAPEYQEPTERGRSAA